MSLADLWAADADRRPWQKQLQRRKARPAASGAPKIAFLPAAAHTAGSHRLRGWLISDALAEHFGWDSLVIPAAFSADRRAAHLERFAPDILYMLRSDHVLNDPGRYIGKTVVFDIDDADYTRDALRPGVETCCKRSQLVIAGSRAVAKWCGQYCDNTRVVWTGTPLPSTPPTPANADRGPVLAWGITSYSRYPHEFDLARKIAVGLQQRLPITLQLYGMRSPKRFANELNELRDAGIDLKVFGMIPYPQFIDSLHQAAVGLQIISPENPYGEGKSFGKILAYLAAGCAIAASDAADHGRFIQHNINGVLADTATQWIDALEPLLRDPAHRAALQAAGYRSFEERLTTHAAATLVDRHLRDLLQ